MGKFVMDETIGADIETFNTHFNITEEVSATINFDDLFEPQPSTSTANIKTEVKTEVTEDYDDGDEDYVPVPAKRPRGRPRLPRAEIPPPRRPRGRPSTAREYADVSDIDLECLSGSEKKEAKYRRMRDLNNAASKRCRVNRKLKIQLESLETQVDSYKKIIIDMIKTKKQNQQIVQRQQASIIEEFDIDTLVKNTLEHM